MIEERDYHGVDYRRRRARATFGQPQRLEKPQSRGRDEKERRKMCHARITVDCTCSRCA